MPRLWGNGIDHRECHEAYYHHLKEFKVMIAHKSPHRGAACPLRPCRSRLLRQLVLTHKPKGTKKQEHGHAVMAEEGDEVKRQQCIGRRQHLLQPVYVMLPVGVLVFLHYGVEPMAIVMQEDAYDGQPSQHIALCPREQSLALRATSVVIDRKSTRLNSSHANISYAVFCLKKKNDRQSSHERNSLRNHCNEKMASCLCRYLPRRVSQIATYCPYAYRYD